MTASTKETVMNQYNENGIVWNADTNQIVARYFPRNEAVINYVEQRAYEAKSIKEAEKILKQWVA